jgi:ATP-dependent helicase/nuclease subunit B
VNLATVPANLPFLETLAARWLALPGDPTRGLILLPTRRAARALAAAFLRAADGRPMLLPRIAAIGALDEAPLALAGALDLPPAVEPVERLAALTRLVLALPEAQGGVRAAIRAWRLARELAALMDEAEWAEIDLRAALRDAADAAHAAHWQVTLDFLRIVTLAWPEWLAERELMNPVARQAALLRLQARAWAAAPPPDPVWIAGTTGALPAVAALLRTAARLPQGRIVLPGLDAAMPEPAWAALEETHPQASLRRLLADLGTDRGDVQRWDGPGGVPAARVATLGAALLPAAALGAWRERGACDLAGLSRLEPADQQEEAAAIALILRDAIERPGRRAALITPDRGLALRVSAELLRWGVVADDSAGEKLADTPPAVFLRLLAQTIAESLAPVPLLALLKHPLAAAGLSTASCRAAARALELAALRGPRPPAGLTGLRRHLAGVGDAPAKAHDLLTRLEACLAPLLRIAAAAASVAPAEALAALVEAGEALAATDADPGPARLWAHEEGEALAATLAEALAALPHLPDQPPAVLPGLLDALLEGAVVRSRRVLRGRAGSDPAGEHPRVFIWGLLEARLQAVDVAVLGGLAEGVWPPAAEPGPWLSRPMRRKAGLPSPEEAVGQAAHDFVQAACAAPEVVLSCPRRRDGAPAVPARWLARLDAYLAGQKAALPRHPAAGWARALDQPAGAPRPAAPPQPRPPLALRPRRLGITEIETWLADPYAIYARHVLRLAALDPIEQATDALDYGTLVHRGLERFLGDVGVSWPPDARRRLQEAMDAALAEADVRPALAAWWAPRLYRIADWVFAQEVLRRSAAPPRAIAAEIRGDWALDVPRGFRLRGRADRIERRADGRLAILDYKTGSPPTAKSVEQGDAPQLPLEAAMAAAGAFGPEHRGEVAELAYWQLTGGFVPGRACPVFGGDPARIATAAADARELLRALIADFDRPERAYLCSPHPARAARSDDYSQLARKAEWDAAGEGG